MTRFFQLIKSNYGAIIGLIMGFYGISFLEEYLFYSSSFERFTFPILIFGTLLSIFFVILFHELGHVIGGLLMGHDFNLLIIGPFKLQKEKGKYRVGINCDITLYGGLTLMIPKKIGRSKTERIFVTSLGPIFSLILGMAALIACETNTDGLYHHFASFINITGSLSFLIFIVTIIPMKTGGMMSDGMQIIMTLRNNNDSKIQDTFIRVIALNQQGVIPSDIPAYLFDNIDIKHVNDSYKYSFLSFLYYKAVEKGNDKIVNNYVEQLETYIDLLSSSFKVDALAELAIYHAIISPDKTNLDRIIQKMNSKTPKYNPMIKHLFQLAIAYSNKNYDKVESLSKNILLSSKYDDGISKMYKTLLGTFLKDRPHLFNQISY